jgi:predicted metalloprotease with PDZ domain
MSFRLRAVAVCVALMLVASAAPAQPPDAVVYRLSFAERAHRLMDVAVTFSQLPAGPLQLRMSRSSPGRYALHEFAKNVLDVRASDPAGKPLTIARPDPYGWDVPQHAGTVQVRYRVFGDRVDGTYLGVDTTHAHINMPAALMWARGLEERAATVQFERPAGTTWRVATQLLPGPDEMTFTAPNLAYLMDSPSEVSDFALETFTVAGGGTAADGTGGGTSRSATIRLAVHHDGTASELKAFTADVERIVRESRNVFRVFPAFEVPGSTYTFIADYLPWASGDGMEHRNSTVLTSPSSIRSNRSGLLDTVAHEFIHAWNVERIRPRSLEPFDFERANMSGELWLGEGFTSYYGPLVLRRAGLLSLEDFASEMGEVVNQLMISPGRLVRSAREMSELAPFVDAATAVDRTTWANTYVSYYTWGAGIGLGLDLSLRSRTGGRVTLDDFMRELWRRHGAPGGRAPGVVDRPYTMDDVRAALTTVSGDGDFAREFLASYVEGRELVDYPALLARAGIVLRKVAAGRPTAGALQLADGAGGVRVMAASPFGSPAYAAGLDRDDTILSLGGVRVASASDWNRLLNTHKPGTPVPVTYRRRDVIVNGILTLVEDPRVQGVPGEEAGQPPTAAQRAFRDAWLNSPGDGR